MSAQVALDVGSWARMGRDLVCWLFRRNLELWRRFPDIIQQQYNTFTRQSYLGLAVLQYKLYQRNDVSREGRFLARDADDICLLLDGSADTALRLTHGD